MSALAEVPACVRAEAFLSRMQSCLDPLLHFTLHAAGLRQVGFDARPVRVIEAETVSKNWLNVATRFPARDRAAVWRVDLATGRCVSKVSLLYCDVDIFALDGYAEVLWTPQGSNPHDENDGICVVLPWSPGSLVALDAVLELGPLPPIEEAGLPAVIAAFPKNVHEIIDRGVATAVLLAMVAIRAQVLHGGTECRWWRSTAWP